MIPFQCDADLTTELVRELFTYDCKNGSLINRVNRNRARIGKRAGSIRPNGYWGVMIRSKNYLLHRVIWLYVYGEVPPILDHINRDKRDNRIENLRAADHTINQQNRNVARKDNTSGLLGVCVMPSGYRRRYKAMIQANGKPRNLGYFKTAQEAHEAYMNAKRKLHKCFAT